MKLNGKERISFSTKRSNRSSTFSTNKFVQGKPETTMNLRRQPYNSPVLSEYWARGETNKLGGRQMNTIKGTSPRRNLISFSALLVSQDTWELYSTNLSEIKFPTPAATRRTLDHWICTTKMQFTNSELSLTHYRTDSNLCIQHKNFRWCSQPVQRNEFLSVRI